MGEAAAPPAFPSLDFRTISPEQQETFLANSGARTATDATASSLVAVADETPLGKRNNLTRIAVGAGAGVVVGLLVGWAIAR